MKFRTILSTAVLAACLSFAGAASALVTNVVNICEVTPGGVNTVDVHLFATSSLEYTFQTLPNGSIYIFAATTMARSRKFMLPAGTYKLTYKHPNNPAVGVYNQNVVVKPYQVAAGRCVFLNPLDRIEPVRRLPQQ